MRTIRVEPSAVSKRRSAASGPARPASIARSASSSAPRSSRCSSSSNGRPSRCSSGRPLSSHSARLARSSVPSVAASIRPTAAPSNAPAKRSSASRSARRASTCSVMSHSTAVKCRCPLSFQLPIESSSGNSLPSARRPSSAMVSIGRPPPAARKRAITRAVALRQQVGQRPPDGLGRRALERRSRAGVPEADPALDVGGHDRVAMRAGDGAEALLGHAQLLLPQLALGDVLAAEEDVLVGRREARAEHEPAIVAGAAAQAQLGLGAVAGAAGEHGVLGPAHALAVGGMDQLVI